MNTPQAKSRHFNSTPISCLDIPDELIVEILSFLTIKSLLRLRCVSKKWKTLFSDPAFIKKHLKNSARNAHLTIFSSNTRYLADCSVIPIPVNRLLENSQITLLDDPCYRLKDKDCSWVVGSCNGLLCLVGFSSTFKFQDIWFRFWNPSMRVISEKLGSFRVYRGSPLSSYLKYTFGFDNTTDTYKVVVLRLYEDDDTISRRSEVLDLYEDQDEDKALWRIEVKVFSLGDNVWKSIQSLPALPLHFAHLGENDGVYLAGTLNWLALRNNFSSIIDWNAITAEQLVIISLDLGTETYTQLQTPQVFIKVSRVEPTIFVLMDCLCFSFDFERTNFVIWKMEVFGVEESWTQFLTITYQDVLIGYNPMEAFHFQLLPLCVSGNGDTLVLAHNIESQAILYSWRDNRVERTRIANGKWWSYIKNYVESLVSTC